MPARERSPLDRLRRAKRLAIGLLVLGVGGAIAMALPGWDDEGPPSPRPASRGVPAGAPPSGAAKEPPPPSACPDPPQVTARRTLAVRVRGAAGPEPDVVVRAVHHQREASCFHPLSEPARTDGDGRAVLQVADPAPPDSYLEVAREDVSGFRHGFVPLEKPRAAEGPADVTLPEGGTLRVVIEGLPQTVRPATVNLEFLPPYGPWLALFPEAAVLPSEDGGLFESQGGWRRLRVRLGDDGAGTVPHVPGDHALSVVVPDAPEGWLVESAASDGPFVAARDADVLRVPEGRRCAYVIRYRRLPAATVRVQGEDGAPLEGAQVAAGFAHHEAGPRLLGGSHAAEAGVATVPLWTGARLPDWTPERLLFVVRAPGRQARVVEAPGGAWYGVDLRVVLRPAESGTFVVEGTLTHEDGRVAAGVPVRLAAAEPWNGQSGLEPFAATTDGEGAWRFEIPEALRPVFAYGRGVRVHVDAEQLEAQSDDAYWRRRWPTLPTMRVQPDAVPLPPPRGRAHADLRLTPP